MARSFFPTAWLVMLSVLLAACSYQPRYLKVPEDQRAQAAAERQMAALPPADRLTSDEQRLRQHAEDFNLTVAGGTLTGAAAGAAIAAAATGDGTAALIGAGIGALVGTVAGWGVAESKDQYYRQEQGLRREIAAVRADNERLAEYAAVTRRVVTTDKARLAEMTAAYESGRITLAEAQEAVESVERNRGVMIETLAELRSHRRAYRDELARLRRNQGDNAPDVQSYEQEVARLESQIRDLEGQLSDLDAALSVSRVG